MIDIKRSSTFDTGLQMLKCVLYLFINKEFKVCDAYVEDLR